MKISRQAAAETAKTLTLSAIEHHLIPIDADASVEESAKKVLSFYNTIADSLDRDN